MERRPVVNWRTRAGAWAAVLCLMGCSSGGNGGTSSTDDGGSGPQAPLLGTTPWHAPECTSIAGAAPVTFSTDDGRTRAAFQEPPGAASATSVAAFAEGSTLAAAVVRGQGNVEIFFSTDTDCSWSQTHTITDMAHARIETAGEYTFIWGYEYVVYVIGPHGEEIRRWVPLGHWQGGGLHGFAAHASNPSWLRGALYSCASRPTSCNAGVQMVESLDGGATWQRVGVAPPFDSRPMVFSPLHLDHAIVIGAPYPAHVTFDGGNQWFPAQGLLDGHYPAAAAIGANGHTAWLVYSVSSLAELPALYISRDGGLNYQEVPIPSNEDFLVGIVHLFPHPEDPDVLYLASRSADAEVSRLDRYDARLQEFSRQEWPASQGTVSSLAFNPADPSRVYIGLAREQ